MPLQLSPSPVSDLYPSLEGYSLEVATYTEEVLLPSVFLQHAHQNKVILVDRETPLGLLGAGDAMITQEKNLTLLHRHADCQVAIFYDPKHHALGFAHAGWRGQVLGIYSEVVSEMGQAFGTCPEDLRVAISPSLGPTKAEFIHYKEELAPWMWDYKESENHFNLWKIAEVELCSVGIRKGHIALPSICTFLDERFHSYRRNRPITRNHTYAKLL